MVIDPAKGVSRLLDEVSQSVAAANLHPSIAPVARATMTAIVLRVCGASALAQAASLDALDASIEAAFMRAHLREIGAGRRPNQTELWTHIETQILRVRHLVGQLGDQRLVS